MLLMTKLIIFVSVILSFYSCKKDNWNGEVIYPEPYFFGAAKATINGVEHNNLKPQLYVRHDSSFTIVLYAYSNTNYRTRGIFFTVPKIIESNYFIKKSSIEFGNNLSGCAYSSFAFFDHDAVLASYDVDSTKPCVLNITRADTVTKEIWGNFHGSYWIKHNGPVPVPLGVEITNGSFYTKLR